MENKEGIYTPKVADDGKKRGVSPYISLITATIPLLLIAYCYLTSGGSFSENGAGAVWWFLVIYYGTVGIPLFIISIVSGVIGLKKDKRNLATVGLVLATLPFLLFGIALLIG